MRIARRKSDGALFRIHISQWDLEYRGNVDPWTLPAPWHFEAIERKSWWACPWFMHYRILQGSRRNLWSTRNPAAFDMEDL